MSIYATVPATGGVPTVTRPSAPGWRVGSKSLNGSECIVAGEFSVADQKALIAGGGTILSQAEAVSQAQTWQSAYPPPGGGA